MAVPVTHVESVSPELVLIDPRLAIDARARLPAPDDTLARLEPDLATSIVAAALRRITELSEVEELPTAGGAIACRSSLRRSRPGARPPSSSPMYSSMTGRPGWSSSYPQTVASERANAAFVGGISLRSLIPSIRGPEAPACRENAGPAFPPMIPSFPVRSGLLGEASEGEQHRDRAWLRAEAQQC